jgi:hypothetical protein
MIKRSVCRNCTKFKECKRLFDNLPLTYENVENAVILTLDSYDKYLEEVGWLNDGYDYSEIREQLTREVRRGSPVLGFPVVFDFQRIRG